MKKRYMETWARISIEKKGKPGPKRDPDAVGTCGICGGPIYWDEVAPGMRMKSRCPDCRMTLQLIQDEQHEQQARYALAAAFTWETANPRIPWQNHRDERDQIPELDEPVLYGLLTRADIPELDRRRAMLAKILTETVNQ